MRKWNWLKIGAQLGLQFDSNSKANPQTGNFFIPRFVCASSWTMCSLHSWGHFNVMRKCFLMTEWFLNWTLLVRAITIAPSYKFHFANWIKFEHFFLLACSLRETKNKIVEMTNDDNFHKIFERKYFYHWNDLHLIFLS